MEDFILLAGIILTLIFIPLRLQAGKKRISLPDALLASAAIAFVGSASFWLRFPSNASSFITLASGSAYCTSILTQMIIFAFSASRNGQRLAQSSIKLTSPYYLLGLIFIFLVNLLIIYLLFANAGIRLLLISAFTQSDTTLLSARKSITASTEGYMAPGIIKIFRDILGPIVICAYMLAQKEWPRSILFWLTVFLLAGGMLISGQRFPLLILMISIGVVAAGSSRRLTGKLKLSNLAFFTTFGLFSFTLMTRFLGRSDQSLSLMASFSGSMVNLYERIFLIVPNEALKTYDYWFNIGPTNGRSWLSDLSILLPGSADLTIANDLHSFGGGSEQGNAPLFFAIDAWFAFGWMGVFFTSIGFVLLLNSLDNFLYKYRSPFNDATRVVIFFYLYQAYSPYLFLLNGGLVLCLAVGLTILTARRPRMSYSTGMHVQSGESAYMRGQRAKSENTFRSR